MQGWDRICHRPENMVARSGIHTAPIRKQAVIKPKNSFRKLLSERFFIFFIIHSKKASFNGFSSNQPGAKKGNSALY